MPRSETVPGTGGTEQQLALPLGPTAEIPDLPEQTQWERMLADYGKTSLSVGVHPLELLRPHLPPGTLFEPGARRARSDSEVAVAGMAVARQRPATANGVVFMLLEDEHGQMDLIIPPPVYERYRPIVRGEPLLLARGKFERRDRNQNVLVAGAGDAGAAGQARGGDGRERGATARPPFRAPLMLASCPPWRTRSSSPAAA